MGQLVLFLNELSVANGVLPLREAEQLVRALIDAIRSARDYKPTLSLNATAKLAAHPVDSEKTVQQVLTGNRFREEWAFLRRLADRSPISEGLANPKALDDVEYLYDDAGAIALGWAHMLETAVVGFLS